MRPALSPIEEIVFRRALLDYHSLQELEAEMARSGLGGRGELEQAIHSLINKGLIELCVERPATPSLVMARDEVDSVLASSESWAEQIAYGEPWYVVGATAYGDRIANALLGD